MEQILVLNSTFEPLHVISWKRALRMLFQEKVEVLAQYDREIRSVSLSIPLPSVLRLLSYVKVKRHHHQVKFTRSNIYSRDRHSCQYCGCKFSANQLTYDQSFQWLEEVIRVGRTLSPVALGATGKKGIELQKRPA